VADRFQTVCFIIRGFVSFLLVYIQLTCYNNLNEKLRKSVVVREIFEMCLA